MYIKAKYPKIGREWYRQGVQGFGSLYGGNQISDVENNASTSLTSRLSTSKMFGGNIVSIYTNTNNGNELVFTNESIFIIDSSTLVITEINTQRALEFINESEWVSKGVSLAALFIDRVSNDLGILDNQIGLDTLDESASLIMLPNAYKDGVLYSVLPEDGTGDFDVVRGSSATRVNASGLVENVQILSSNLVQNGDFATDSDWSKDANWAIANGVATSTGGGRMFQSIPFLETNVGTKVKVSFDITERTSDGVQLNCYGAESQVYTDVGTYTFIGTTTNTLNLYINNSGVGNLVGSIDNVSVKEITDDTNLPRIDYTSGSPELLIEPQSTNLVNVSEDFSSTSWNTNGGEVGKTLDVLQANPSGSIGSYAIEGLSGLGRLSKNISVTASTDYTLSFYAKNINATTLKAVILNKVGTPTVDYISQVNSTSWSRVEINFTTGTGTVSSIFLTRDLPVGESVYLWGVQLEENSFATSYIPTNGAIATRLADDISVDLTSFSLTSITETIDGVEQTPITTIPSTYTIPQGNINKIVMI